MHPHAVVGTYSWGGAVYGKVLRGSGADTDTLRECMEAAKACGLSVFDLAQDYGLGAAQRIMGSFGTEDVILSAKYTPMSSYKSGQVRRSLERDLREFHRDYVDIYWLHLPTDIEQNLAEMIALYREGKIRSIGISNFNLQECRKARAILDEAGIPLYGVQNHYSLLSREWEENGLVAWCRENGAAFWAWAVLEEGILTDPDARGKKGAMKLLFARKQRRLRPLFAQMRKIGNRHGLTIPQVAMAFCSSKGIVPVCGCRRAYQAQQLAGAVSVTLSDEELRQLAAAADQTQVKILGADLFRFAVRGSR
ncbi:MAG: aldo/keto reductase [Oscillospiraceae bacterium]|nr:aldo/keto reductase [Oscillospiraceae bacterium]